MCQRRENVMLAWGSGSLTKPVGDKLTCACLCNLRVRTQFWWIYSTQLRQPISSVLGEMVRRLAVLLLAAALCEARFTAPTLAVRSAGARAPLLSALAVRGGGSDEDVVEKKPNAVSELLGQLPPCTRAHVVAVAVCTAVALSGVIDPDQMLSLDPVRTIFKLQLWRPLSAATFLGKPSMASATSVYLLIKYGRELEAAVGTGAFSKFLALQVLLLTLGGSAFSIPFARSSRVAKVSARESA